MAEILKAKPVVKVIYQELAQIVENQTIEPVLELILIGNDPAAEWYVNNLVKQGAKRKIQVNLHNLSPSIRQDELLKLIKQFNEDVKVSGIMLQKPLPEQLDEAQITAAISPAKDVDGFHPQNLGKMLLEQEALLPCTPQAALRIIEHYGVETNGKHVVVLGRSNIVGKPLANLLLRKSSTGNATVTVCHSKTRNISEHCLRADVLITAIGRAGFVTSDMVKDGAVVIDVGTNLIIDEAGNEKYVGDVDYDAVINKAGAITPVPGGVGSVTTALLLKNVVLAAKYAINNKIY